MPGAKVRAGEADHDPPAVAYVHDWMERFPEAFAPDTLTLEHFRSQVSRVFDGGFGLGCSIAMATPGELHLTTMPYPRGDTHDPASWQVILELLQDTTRVLSTANVFPTRDVLRVLEDYPAAPLWVDFVEESWRVWDSVTASRKVLRGAVQTCTELELSLPRTRRLLEFRGIGEDPHCVLFEVHDQQYAACIVNPRRPGVYAIQSVQGEAGRAVFEQIARRLRLRALPGGLDGLTHPVLVRLAGQGLLL